VCSKSKIEHGSRPEKEKRGKDKKVGKRKKERPHGNLKKSTMRSRGQKSRRKDLFLRERKGKVGRLGREKREGSSEIGVEFCSSGEGKITLKLGRLTYIPRRKEENARGDSWEGEQP